MNGLPDHTPFCESRSSSPGDEWPCDCGLDDMRRVRTAFMSKGDIISTVELMLYALCSRAEGFIAEIPGLGDWYLPKKQMVKVSEALIAAREDIRAAELAAAKKHGLVWDDKNGWSMPE